MVGPNTSKQASIDTHTRAQCSNASVGLTQARPNNKSKGSGDFAHASSLVPGPISPFSGKEPKGETI